jgi:hypothetical protein
MTKRHRKRGKSNAAAQPSAHYDNLIRLREDNPKAFEQLGANTQQSVERYELEQLAPAFEYRAGHERLLELRQRSPRVFALLSPETRQMVERYAETKRAYQIVNASEDQ